MYKPLKVNNDFSMMYESLSRYQNFNTSIYNIKEICPVLNFGNLQNNQQFIVNKFNLIKKCWEEEDPFEHFY